MEVKVNCVVCEHAGHLGQDFSRLRHHIKWDLYECPNCSFQFWYPFDQSPREYFEDTYLVFSDACPKPSKLGARHQTLIKHMPIKAGTVLDIGCGDGSFLAKLRDSGFEVWGIDFNRRAIAKAKRLWNLQNLFPLSIYDFATMANRQRRFTMVTFFEVLEHMENPDRFMSVVRALLDANGFIALSVPDSKLFGPWEFQVNVAPYHTAYWNTKTLSAFLSKHHFDVLMIKKIEVSLSLEVINALMKFGIIKSIPSTALTAAGPVKARVDPHKEVLRKALKLLCRPVAFPISALMYAVGRGRTIFALAQLKCGEEVTRDA
ncbi:class I SAM-dependent methyltransferase [Nitrospira sp. Kam-Ns4a]